ncbi:MAG: heme o synthase [Hyphomicrobiales bacterium]|nr:heme o synthase [Hyphomicrobiales bacterium]
MSDTAPPTVDINATVANEAELSDYWALLKPRVMSLAILTALAGMVIAPGSMHPVIAGCALIFIAMGAGASGALNMWYDADIDAVMARTATRPIPRGKVPADEALAMGVVLGVGSVMGLGVLVNWVAGALLGMTILYYIVFYTMYLKRRTPQNIVIGGAAGAFPPMIGWAAATGSVSWESVLLFLIIFVWTPPHFWALALLRVKDYERAGIPMLPVTAGADETRRQILIYSILMAPIGVLPAFVGIGGWLYLAVSLVGGAAFLYGAIRAYIDRGEDQRAMSSLRRLFVISIFYLFALFGVILVEHAVGLAGS